MGRQPTAVRLEDRKVFQVRCEASPWRRVTSQSRSAAVHEQDISHLPISSGTARIPSELEGPFWHTQPEPEPRLSELGNG